MKKAMPFAAAAIFAALLFFTLKKCDTVTVSEVTLQAYKDSLTACRAALIDTVAQNDTVIKYIVRYRPVPYQKVPQPPPDTGIVYEMPETFLYSDSLADTNISVYWAAQVTGNLDTIGIGYRLKQPRIITKIERYPQYVEMPPSWGLQAFMGATLKGSPVIGITYVKPKDFGIGLFIEPAGFNITTGVTYRIK